MSDLEVLLIDIGETATKELAKQFNPIGLQQIKSLNKNILIQTNEVLFVKEKKSAY